MALFPITAHYRGDFIPHLVAVDTDDTIARVAAKVAGHTAGRRLPEPPAGTVLEVYRDSERLDPTATLGSLGLEPLGWLDVVPHG